MIKKVIPYIDYNGVERTEEAWFNFSKAEITEMEMSTTGGLAEQIQAIIRAQDTPSLIKIFKDLILKAYGVKSPDGRRFIKSAELSKEFSETEAYSILFMELATNAEQASKFVNGIIPADVAEQVNKDETVKAMLSDANVNI